MNYSTTKVVSGSLRENLTRLSLTPLDREICRLCNELATTGMGVRGKVRYLVAECFVNPSFHRHGAWTLERRLRPGDGGLVVVLTCNGTVVVVPGDPAQPDGALVRVR